MAELDPAMPTGTVPRGMAGSTAGHDGVRTGGAIRSLTHVTAELVLAIRTACVQSSWPGSTRPSPRREAAVGIRGSRPAD